jgi:hypothetical protein
MDWSKFTARVAAITFITVLNATLVMLLWNFFLVPTIDGVKEIGFITSMGLIGLFGILFKDMGVSLNFKD